MRKLFFIAFVALAGCSATMQTTRDPHRLASFTSDCDTLRFVKATRIMYCGILDKGKDLTEYPVAQVRK